MHRPNQSGFASACNFAGSDTMTSGSSKKAVLSAITANVDLKTTQIVAMTGRVTIISEEVKTSLRDGADVETVQISPCIIAVMVGKSPQQHRLHFPVPVLRSRSKARIARKSSYVEVTAPICGPMVENRISNFMYPLFLNGRSPVLWNMPHLNMDCLPIVDTAKSNELQWMITHLSLMFSTRERTLRERSMASRTENHKDVRINFKDSLFSLFMHSTGLQGGRASFFGLNNPAKGGVHVLIFVSSLRLDMANHTIVLDAALLPLHDGLMRRMQKLLAALADGGICQIKVDDDELKLWKEVIPAMVERCRQWEHRPSCEYLQKSKIPLFVENGKPYICSCGEGTLPPKFISCLSYWDTVSKYAVRAAISPSFSVPFVEPVKVPPSAQNIPTPEDLNGDCCKICKKVKSSTGTKLLTCARCHMVKYCSVECQRADWKDHKKFCTK
jgi:MYND finger